MHIRQSGPDLRTSPSWAFSNDGDDGDFDTTGMGLPDADFPSLKKSFVDFAQWVFGPTGIGSLRLLAYGDFSHGGRFAENTLLLCRRGLSPGAEVSDRFLRFREVRKGGDVELWELFKREEHVLSACPCDPLMYVKA